MNVRARASIERAPGPEESVDVAGIAAAIGEPARARMLFCLMDGHARTSTELAVISGVTPSTASVHLARLKNQRLVNVFVQGKHRYYSLVGEDVAAALEALTVLAGSPRVTFQSRAPTDLCAARTCYDHMAGAIAVSLHDRFSSLGWFSAGSTDDPTSPRAGRAGNHSPAYRLTDAGENGFASLGIDVNGTRALRRRFACACLDWSERRPHLGGALGAAFLKIALNKQWVIRHLDSRALTVTKTGRREMATRFGVAVNADS
jgi:DNA-binding transcriptional ArsR family regulator